MAKASSLYVCNACAASYPKWAGRCEACGGWNTLQEESRGNAAFNNKSGGRALNLTSLNADTPEPPRIFVGMPEFDRVLGGGLVRGSATLIGGDPGIGKSTLLVQAAARLAQTQARVVYVSGEEAEGQVRMRARRLGLADAPVQLAAETELAVILGSLSKPPLPTVLIVDSIQTLRSEGVEAAPGTVTQVRAAALDLVRFAKSTGTAVFIVGHVTKDGQLAGPRTVEHMVDTVLYFEGDATHQCRILRAVKNRFGPIDEIGVFEMTGLGLAEIADPSAIFIGERRAQHSGSAIFVGIEGTRPLLVEVQALVAPAAHGTPRRSSVGRDPNRLSMLLAVLDARANFSFAGYDVFLNVVGGLRLTEPAADLACIAALISAMLNVPLPADAVFFGEIGLSGMVRAVAHTDARLKEASKHGFSTAYLAQGGKYATPPLELCPLDSVLALAQMLKTGR